jgi:hypothetical protein
VSPIRELLVVFGPGVDLLELAPNNVGPIGFFLEGTMTKQFLVWINNLVRLGLSPKHNRLAQIEIF